MKKFWKKYRVWLIILAVVALFAAVGLMSNAADSHAGHDQDTDPHTEQTQNADSHTQKTQNADPHAGHDHSGYKAEKSYSVSTDDNGRYIVQVKDAHGDVIFSRGDLIDKPICTAVNDQVLMVSHTSDADYGSHWAVFCNVQTNKVSGLFNGCLYAKDTYVAYGAMEDNIFKVHVQDAFNKSAYYRSYVLEGAASPDGRSIISKVTPNKEGSLLITYWAGEAEKTMTVPVVPAK